MLVAAALTPLVIIGAQLVRLGTVEQSRYESMATDNLETDVRLAAPRGNILDRAGRIVATNQRTWTVTYSPYRQSNEAAADVLARLQSLLGESMRLTPDAILAQTPRSQRVTIARRMSQDAVLPLIERPTEFPGVRLQEDFRREYAYPTTMALVVGHMGKIPEGRTSDFPAPRYRPDDEVGRAGLESALEPDLAGEPGLERLTRDARGRLLDEPTLMRPSHAGKDIVLTLDGEIQTLAYTQLGSEVGSIVVMDVQNGDLLVMASTPTFDSANPGLQMIDGRPVGYVNKVARGQFPPASTFKLIGASAAIRAGISPDETVDCTGSFMLEGWRRPFWCNVRTGHGHMTLAGALKVSCNDYFYELGQRLGPELLRAEAERFGYGRSTGFLLSEASGNLPDVQVLTPGELTNFSIGQGRFLATPLQVVRAVAAIANGSYLPTPRVVLSKDGVPTEVAPGVAVDLPLGARPAILNGMRRAVNETGGTVYKAHIPRAWGVVGKSGTAENSSGGVDAWFAGFFPEEAPRWAFVVQIEGADGHGGEIAGPIGREIIRAILRSEGRITDGVEQPVASARVLPASDEE